MQLLHTLSGLLLFALLTKCGLADIGLKLRNSAHPNYGRGRTYLPPPVQELPIDEEYINVRQEPQKHHKFQETSYGDAKYQIFEVHNHYEQPTASARVQQPRTTTHEIRIQHVNRPPGGHDDSLDLSFLSFAAGVGGDGQHVTITEEIPSSRAAPAPVTVIPIPFPSSYQHNEYSPSHDRQPTTPGGAAEYLPPLETTQHTPVVPTAPVFRAPDYLPPHHEENIHHHQQLQQQQYNAAEYLPPHQTNFQGNGYLPPHTSQHQPQAPHPNAIHDHQHQHQQGIERPAFKGSDYLPPFKNNQHQSRNEPHYAPNHHQTGENHGFKGPDYLPPFQDLHPHHHHQQQPLTTPDYHQHQNHAAHHSQPAESATFKAPDYLPPFQDQQYPAQHQSHASQPRTTFKAPDYLPPHEDQRDQQHHDHHPAEGGANDAYKGPDYLPPHNDYNHQQHHAAQAGENNPSKRPDYVSSFKDLHPHHQQQHQQLQEQQHHQHEAQYNQHNGGQHQHNHHQQQQQQHQQQHTADGPSFKAPDYLPPHQEHYPQLPATPSQFKAPDYLPPQQEQYEEQHQEHSVEHSRAPGHLPAGYDYVNPDATQLSQAQHYEQPEAPTLATPTLLPAGYEFNKPANAEQAIAELHSQQQEPQYQHQEQALQQQEVQSRGHTQYQQHQAPTQATISHHQDQQIVQAQIQVGEKEGEPEVVYGRHSQEAERAYLPPQRELQSTVTSPVTTVQAQTTYQVQQPNAYEQTVSTPHYGSLSNTEQQHFQQYSAPVTTSTAPVQTVPALHSLSSFMNTVQPFERYGAARFTTSRRPFPAYGPPPQPSVQQPSHHAVPQVQQATIEVAPMYREQASRPQYYAPQMSYATSAVHATSYASQTTFHQPQYVQHHEQEEQGHQEQHQISHDQHQESHSHAQPAYTGSTQARQGLQRLMSLITTATATAQAPTLPTTAAALPTASLTAGKIRTVQIVNPNAVKTLKVLETSDKDGVKTIKILGHSNEDPMGEHRVVKVVSSNAYNGHENHVQTVKIFNDHKEVTVSVAPKPIATVATAPATNGYLPPSKTHVKRRTSTGRARHRY